MTLSQFLDLYGTEEQCEAALGVRRKTRPRLREWGNRTPLDARPTGAQRLPVLLRLDRGSDSSQSSVAADPQAG